METRFEGEARNVFSLDAAKMWGAGKRSLEWDLNDWKWDGDRFIASPLNPPPSGGMNKQFPVGNSSNSSSSCSDEANGEVERSERDLEKKRRVIVVEDENNEEAAGNLSLKLGSHGYAADEGETGSSGKKSKIVIGSSRAVCQVEGCGSDLSNAKDYHRRHKVCETHSKATKAFVGNALQRFCQQCSRFHILQEFDEGKRSCRRRLAGHNKRRRKTHPEASVAPTNSQNNEQTNSYLLISLLRILSNMHSNKSDQPTDQVLISHLLNGVIGQSNENGDKNGALLLQDSHNLVNSDSSTKNEDSKNHNNGNNGHVKMNNFDLNDMYVDSDEGNEEDAAPVNRNVSLESPSWLNQNSQQSSPPQTSANSDSVSGQSPSNSGCDNQNRTDRIIFKLFGKEPNDIPLVVRTQILDWLSHSPTDIESYIRPGCVVLTLYIRQPKAVWEELCDDLTSSLSKLVDLTDDPFWRTGWMYVRVQHQAAFVFNGEVVVDKPLPTKFTNYSNILSIKPIAVPSFSKAQFLIKGVNLSKPSTRLLCAIEGKYLTLLKESEGLADTYSCSIPPSIGRGFIEIDDQGFSNSFFPFLVAEEELCSEVRTLENSLDINETDLHEASEMVARNNSLKFLNEMGWLLHRSQLKITRNFNGETFPSKQFIWLVHFSLDREWCSVLRKLFDILHEESQISNLKLSEMGLLHRAVGMNSKPLVEFLMDYVPKTSSIMMKDPKPVFRLGDLDLSGFTPLHIVATQKGLENMLQILTSDPQMHGIEIWKNGKDRNGFTPEYYADKLGHDSYIELIQKRRSKRDGADHVALQIPPSLVELNVSEKKLYESAAGFDLERNGHTSTRNQCKICSQQLAFRSGHHSLVYRPAMLFMIAIAAVCVCAALYFKSGPKVEFVFRPFRWELLEYGTD